MADSTLQYAVKMLIINERAKERDKETETEKITRQRERETETETERHRQTVRKTDRSGAEGSGREEGQTVGHSGRLANR